MRLNERPLIFPSDELWKRAMEMLAQGNKSFCPIVLLTLPGGAYTWRGQGQKTPHGSRVFATAKVFCPDDGMGRYPVDVFLGEITDPIDASYLMSWSESNFFEPHDLVINKEPLAVWFRAVRSEPKPFNQLSTAEATRIARQIVRRADSEQEIRQKLNEAGFNGNAAAILPCHSGGPFMAMALIYGPNGGIISV